MDEEEIKKELKPQGIIAVKRISIRYSLYVLTIKGQIIPKKINIGYLKKEKRPFDLDIVTLYLHGRYLFHLYMKSICEIYMELWGRRQKLWTIRVTLTYDLLILKLYDIRYILTSWFICHIWRESVIKHEAMEQRS